MTAEKLKHSMFTTRTREMCKDTHSLKKRASSAAYAWTHFLNALS